MKRASSHPSHGIIVWDVLRLREETPLRCGATLIQPHVLRSCEAAKLRSCEAAKLRSCEAAKLRSCEAAKLRSCEAAKLRSCEAAKLRSCEARGNGHRHRLARRGHRPRRRWHKACFQSRRRLCLGRSEAYAVGGAKPRLSEASFGFARARPKRSIFKIEESLHEKLHHIPFHCARCCFALVHLYGRFIDRGKSILPRSVGFLLLKAPRSPRQTFLGQSWGKVRPPTASSSRRESEEGVGCAEKKRIDTGGRRRV